MRTPLVPTCRIQITKQAMPVSQQYTTTVRNGVGKFPDMICDDDYGTTYKVLIPKGYLDFCTGLKRGDRFDFTAQHSGRTDSNGREVLKLTGLGGDAVERAIAPVQQPTEVQVVDCTTPGVGAHGLTRTEVRTISAISSDLLAIAIDLRSQLIGHGVVDTSERIAILQSTLSAARDHVLGKATYGDRQYRD